MHKTQGKRQHQLWAKVGKKKALGNYPEKVRGLRTAGAGSQFHSGQSQGRDHGVTRAAPLLPFLNESRLNISGQERKLES